MLKIWHTPYSREEFELAADRTGDPLEDARRFYIRALQGYGGNTSQNTHKGWTSNTAPHIVDNYFKSLTWKNRLVFLDEIVDKLRGFQIENLQVIDLLPKYDYPQNFIYLDPPYVRKTRNDNKRYKHEMSDQDHIDLFEKANALKCKAAISGYECPLYEEMYTAGGWMKHIGAGNRMTTGKRLVREALWTNYQPNITLSLFN